MNASPLRLLPVLMAALAPLAAGAGTFGDDAAFLARHTDVIVLQDKSGQAKLVVSPLWEGRVMTSASAGDGGFSYGWINRDHIASGMLASHMNAFGGEDRFWMGPEGGQFSVFFAKGVPFDFEHWFTPAIFDTLPFDVVSQGKDNAVFDATFKLKNYSGTTFDVQVTRKVQVLAKDDAWKAAGVAPIPGVGLVGYTTDNQIKNVGPDPWTRDTGLLSIWILGQYNPSEATTIVVPIQSGDDADLGVKATTNYFGEIPAERISVHDDVVFLSADGKYRSKIGINPRRSRAVLGSYDAENHVLTIVRFNQPDGVTDYVNSLWKHQDNPYGGDAENAYNDGPATPGARPMGPFLELESSSPAAALAPGETLTHVRSTVHLTGPESDLDTVSRAVLGVSLEEIAGAFKAQ
jgi:hypothetical protein